MNDSSDAPVVGDHLVLKQGEARSVDRGHGISSIPLVGKWNASHTAVTTGITTLQPGAAVPLHSHNVDEAVLVLDGEAVVTIGGVDYRVLAGDATWIPATVEHRFSNSNENDELRIYWTYGGAYVTRTMSATGITVEHLSSGDRAHS